MAKFRTPSKPKKPKKLSTARFEQDEELHTRHSTTLSRIERRVNHRKAVKRNKAIKAALNAPVNFLRKVGKVSREALNSSNKAPGLITRMNQRAAKMGFGTGVMPSEEDMTKWLGGK
jgi:hypothetical protein